jgi:hypothetical protein
MSAATEAGLAGDQRDEALFACVEAYRQAAGRLAAAERAACRGETDAGEHLRCAEALIATRLAFAKHLVGVGWMPPPAIAVELARDRALTRQGNGALGG